MPAQIEARRAKIDCSRKQVTNDGPNWKQFVGPDEGVAYSSVYYLNMPIKHLLLATIKYFCWIRADPLLIFWGKEQGQCELNSCLRHFAEIEEVRSSSLMRVQICGVWPRAVMRETAEMAGPAAEKKIGRWQCKHRDPHDKLLMCWFDHAYAHNNPCEVLFLILVQLILVGITTTLATSLMVKSIISSLVLQAILSIFSGHVLWQALVLYFRCRHRLQVFRNSGPQMHSYCENLFDSESTPGICKTCNDSMQEPPVRISETAASLISHGTASGDRPKLSSMPIA